jgi:ABC-type multidrug transport system ATPase subunit
MPALEIRLENIGKKFYQRWLFREIDHDFSEQPHLALVGTNGSGKSTLLKIIAGQMAPSEGKMTVCWQGAPLPLEKLYRHLSWSGPYVELYSDLTLREQIDLHFRFNACRLPAPLDLIELLDFQAHQHKPLRWYSSGMMQRLKVGLALFTRSELLLLDEPTSNMDQANAQRMLALIAEHTQDRLFVLASNMDREYQSAGHIIHLGEGRSLQR